MEIYFKHLNNSYQQKIKIKKQIEENKIKLDQLEFELGMVDAEILTLKKCDPTTLI